MNRLPEVLAAELRAEAARKQLSHRAIANRLGVTAMWVQRRFSGETQITVEDLFRICQVLELDMRELMPPPTASAPAS